MQSDSLSQPGHGVPAVGSTPERVCVLGVDVTNVSTARAIDIMSTWVREPERLCHAVYIVNAHTLNLAWSDPDYRAVLKAGDIVFGDGTGVRMAARWSGVGMIDNLVGTDLMPAMMTCPIGKTFGYYLLGGHEGVAERAAQSLREQFDGIRIAGSHHGYLDRASSTRVIEQINDSGADVLMVAMGNPDQECWIHAHRAKLRVPVCVGVGGLFDHWAGNLVRAPLWVRRLGLEWVQILMQQPGRKWRRYLLGNPLFISRMIRTPRNGAETEGSSPRAGDTHGR